MQNDLFVSSALKSLEVIPPRLSLRNLCVNTSLELWNSSSSRNVSGLPPAITNWSVTEKCEKSWKVMVRNVP